MGMFMALIAYVFLRDLSGLNSPAILKNVPSYLLGLFSFFGILFLVNTTLIWVETRFFLAAQNTLASRAIELSLILFCIALFAVFGSLT